VELSELSTRRFLMIEILAGALYVDAYLFAFGGLMIGAFTTLYGLTAIKPEDLDKRIPPISDVLPRRRCARFGPNQTRNLTRARRSLVTLANRMWEARPFGSRWPPSDRSWATAKPPKTRKTSRLRLFARLPA
jgi:hypothetical protein